MSLPRRPPHPDALFSLVPKNQRAFEVVNQELNHHLVSEVDSGPALDIGHIQSGSGCSTTLATLGRGSTADIYVPGSIISKIQCSFELLEEGFVLFHDESKAMTSQVSGANATPFQHGRPRKVVVLPDVNTTIGFGGVRRNLVEFDLRWHSDDNAKALEAVKKSCVGRKENPRLARTIEEADTALPSRRETRVHSTAGNSSLVRWKQLGELGSGEFGEVVKGVNLDSGRLMAIKQLKRPPQTTVECWGSHIQSIKREVNILIQLDHEHVVDYIASQGSGMRMEIFMGLKHGNLASLLDCCDDTNSLAETVLGHMLRALDYLAAKKIIHRDVKPANILYLEQPSSETTPYKFQLGDFGLSTPQDLARTIGVGTPLFMAPEMLNNKQTDKVDIWSLYVTVVWILNEGSFRKKNFSFRCLQDVQRAILAIAATSTRLEAIKEMARTNPEERASAAQMLVKCFKGAGLSSRGKIPVIPPLSSSQQPQQQQQQPYPPPRPRPPLANRAPTTAIRRRLRDRRRCDPFAASRPQPQQQPIKATQCRPTRQAHPAKQATGSGTEKPRAMPGGFPNTESTP